MKLSVNWLNDYLAVNMEPQQLAETLTSLGLEVESHETWSPVPGGLKGVVAGEVISCSKHPNADKLSITTVNIGQPELLTIVCGAPNVQQGQKVLVATIGTVLGSQNKPFTIQKTKIRGETSEGMICAQDELGLGNDHSGIMVLPPDTIPGTPAATCLNIATDTVFEIAITPNRIDCASHFGVARDLAARLAISQNITLRKPPVDAFSVDNNSKPFTVIIENTAACSRYSGLTISGVSIAPSPQWLLNKLSSIGLTPVNNVVDITNFVLHEIGQPLHAFDADKINGKNIFVKTLPDGTPFTTLDGIERKLSAADLMICDANGGLCIAGIFGGAVSGITPQTKNIFLESACFNSVYIRRTSKRHGLSTDASFRFERGTDPEITVYALKRAALLIKEIAGGQISSTITDICSTPSNPAKIELSFSRMSSLMGINIDPLRIKKILSSLDISVLHESSEGLTVSVPLYRVDVKTEADIVEELLRIHGYNTVEPSHSVSFAPVPGRHPDPEKLRNSVSDLLAFGGFNEIMCNSLSRSDYYTNTTVEKNSVFIINALSRELNVMRQTLLFGGLESILLNINHRTSNLRLFEFGNCYAYNKKNSNDPLDSYHESMHLGLFLLGNNCIGNWTTTPAKMSFFTLKAWVEKIFNHLNIPARITETCNSSSLWLNGGLSYLFKNNVIADAGIVHQNLLSRFDIKNPVYFAEINWSLILSLINTQPAPFSELPRYPEVRRDLALLLDRNVSFGQLSKLAFAAEKKLLRNMWLFDSYEDNKLGENKKSYAIAFILQDFNKTLTDSEVDKTMNNLIALFKKELDAQLR